MFYSEALLQKTGPLARAWLSANVERKLSKSHVLSSDIGDSVNAIVDENGAPLALRLSGTLLLGIVRIYSRKARYLLDDCNEAILKIKMAFRPGNVDLPNNQSHMANSETLNLPDVITDIDILGPGPDPSLLSQLPDADILLDFNSSQQLRLSVERGRRASSVGSVLLDDDNLLDPSSTMKSVDGLEIGRRDTAHRSMLEDADTTIQPLEDAPLDVGINFDIDNFDLDPVNDTTNLGDVPMDDAQDDIVPPLEEAGPANQRRDSASPLSSARSSVDRELDRTFNQDADQTIFEQEEESAQQAQRAKKRKVLQQDALTQIHGSQIREQVADRSKILKPAAFLPKDPLLLALMEMQRNGSFVSNILGDGRSKGWAPELRGVLSLEVIRQSSGLKRKRDDAAPREARAGSDMGVSFAEDPVEREASEEQVVMPADDLPLENTNNMFDPEQTELAGDDLQMADDFNDTTMPLLHPNDSGPVSVGTKHAVHLLRARFGPDAESSPNKRQNSSVLFHELLPEKRTTRADATKMFFETLVLATKDAIKVEQAHDKLGGPLRMRAKRGLWGAWAEMEAGGEIDEQQEAPQTPRAVAA